MRRIALLVILGLCLGAVALGHLGALHPVGDTVSVVSPILALFGLIAALLLGGPAGLVGAALLVSWLGVWGVRTFGPDGPAGEIAIYQKNLWYRNGALEALAADIRAVGADVVTLQEVSDRNARLLTDLAGDYPHQHVCDYSRWSDLAILSRHPFVAGTALCSRQRGVAAVQVRFAGRVASVASVHLTWPYPYNQAERLEQIAPVLADLPRPVILGGDFNMFPNTRVSRRIARLTDTRELRQLRPTLYLRYLPMYLDHVLAPGGRVEWRPWLGSDHAGLLGRVSLGKALDGALD